MTRLLDAMTRRHRPQTNLAREDRFVLFPSLGQLAPNGEDWLVEIHGDVSSAGKLGLAKRMMLRLLKRTMGAANEEMNSPLFQERIARFVARDRSGRRVAVQIGDTTFKLPKKTRPNGHFQAAVRVPARLVNEWAETAAVGSERYLQLEVPDADAIGQAYLVEPTGLSVISDIDDTLKHSYVACRRTLLTNTFLRPFETIPGMATLFRQWWAEGAAFHYVSSSPWQLYEHLAEHLASEGFPGGSFHLRAFRLRDHLLRRLLLLRRSGKLSVIRGILRMFPQRRFLLVGDSGEHDPEIYGALARRFPRQIAGLLIRQLDGPSDPRHRFTGAFRGIDPSLVRVYREASELNNLRLQS
jgi:phosphatidate phosphatase APP1